MLWTPGECLKIRPYRIDAILEIGGFSIAYQATHLELNHQVVIKTINDTLQSDPEYPKFVQQFILEGKTLAKLLQNPHPAIVRVSDLFQEAGIYCLVMDLVVGKSLFDTIRKHGKIPEIEAVAIIRQIGEALSEVHQAGIVHRDAHPGNIMLRHNGQAVLIDFGIACELTSAVLHTDNHPFNPSFAPWEQQVEGSGEVTVDIYTLAASLYYAVTGKLPTSSYKRQFKNMPLPSAKNFGVKDWVNQAIEKGMESDPQKRPQSMKDWLIYLQEPMTETIFDLSVQLKSERGIDYSCLRDLLAAGNWKDADQETLNMMLKAAKRENEGYFDGESIDDFPGDDLRTIDQLWIKYSQGRFGFSVQKKIWLECGGNVDYDTECKLADRVGWRTTNLLNKDVKWLNYDNLTFNNHKETPLGHLPCVVGGISSNVWCGEFFSRTEKCKL